MSPTPLKPNVTTKSRPASAAAPQARLILQDPLAYDQSTVPSLRTSKELAAEAGTGSIDREKARELWESLSLEPEAAARLQTERKKQLSLAEKTANEASAAKARATDLQAQLNRARDERFNHPMVYAGAASLLGLGALWLLERRKRVRLQDRELALLAAQSPAFSVNESIEPPKVIAREREAYVPQLGSTFFLEDSPDLANDFATDLSGLSEGESGYKTVEKQIAETTKHFSVDPPAISDAPIWSEAGGLDVLENTQFVLATSERPQPIPLDQATPQQVITEQAAPVITEPPPPAPQWAQPKTAAIPKQEALPDVVWQRQDTGLFSTLKRVLSKKPSLHSGRDVLSSAHSQLDAQESIHASTGAPSTLVREDLDDATQMLYDEEAQEAFEQELLAQQLSAGLQAGYNPDRANIELLSQTRAMPHSDEGAMEHLLELRTAVSGLCALGRPEGAVKLLEEHIAADPTTCAWAYLEYMQMCEQIGLRDEFEAVRKNYREHFNRMAPYWHEPNSNVLGLDGYARAAGELCVAWSQGLSHARNTLASWLVGPLLSRKLVQLPAYHDLFDLYEMLEFVDDQNREMHLASKDPSRNTVMRLGDTPSNATFISDINDEAEQEFVPTVSLLDLDYEFSSDVTLPEKTVEQSEKAVTIVKTGNFSVDFNVAGTLMGSLSSVPADLAKK